MIPSWGKRSPVWKPSIIQAMRSLSPMRENILWRRTECGRQKLVSISKCHLVRSPNPKWTRHLVLGDGGRIFVRPIKPDDDALIRDLLGHVSKEDLRLRFFDSIKEFSQPFIAKLTKLDEARAMAFVAFDEASSEMLGVVWLYCDSMREAGEYAILLRSDLKGRGLGWALMQRDHRIRKIRRSEPHRRSDSPGKFRHAENVPGVRDLRSRPMPRIAVSATLFSRSKAGECASG